jgi:DNA-binding transcriptional ArsR family regulator
MGGGNDLRAELADLRDRVARLEQRAAAHQEEEHPLAAPVEEAFAKADEAAKRYPIGQLRVEQYFRIHRPHENEYGRFVDGHTVGFDALLALPPDAVARSLAGLAHPARLAIYKALLTGSKDAPTLLEAAGLNTTGQLYHHLREMEEVGLVVRRGRNLWAHANLHAYALALAVGQILIQWRGESTPRSPD